MTSYGYKSQYLERNAQKRWQQEATIYEHLYFLNLLDSQNSIGQKYTMGNLLYFPI